MYSAASRPIGCHSKKKRLAHGLHVFQIDINLKFNPDQRKPLCYEEQTLFDCHSRLLGRKPIERAALRRGAAALQGVMLDQPQQLLIGIGLAQIVIGSQVTGHFAMLLGNARSDHDHRHAFERLIGADIAQQIKAVHARHFDVRQHQGRALVLQTFHGLQAVSGQRDAVAFALQQTLGDAAHGDGVIHHQHQRHRGLRSFGAQQIGTA